MKAVLLLLLASLVTPHSFASELIRHPRPVGERDLRNIYAVDLLRLALDKTQHSHGSYRLESIAESMPQSRAISELAAGEQLDVLWTMTSREREAQLLPIRIPIYKGLIGYRLLMIREEDQAWFRKLETLDQLRQLRAGQGHDWPDTDILLANRIEVERASGYDNLFTMLQQGRFDFLPRGVNEVQHELGQRQEMGLIIEPTLLIQYPAASYFFVSRNNPALATRIEAGLRRAIEDGSFDKLFYNHPVNRQALADARLEQRRRLILANPLLPEETPLDQDQLWFEPEYARNP